MAMVNKETYDQDDNKQDCLGDKYRKYKCPIHTAQV